jgi:hypothetical protein
MAIHNLRPSIYKVDLSKDASVADSWQVYLRRGVLWFVGWTIVILMENVQTFW